MADLGNAQQAAEGIVHAGQARPSARHVTAQDADSKCLRIVMCSEQHRAVSVAVRFGRRRVLHFSGSFG
jgi:hypothetical protein